MSRPLGLIPKVIFLLFSLGLLFTSATDADFVDKKILVDNKMSATTLNFSKNNTATNSPISKLFDINGIVPGGFQVESVRLKNEGQSNLFSKISSEITGGDSNFCQSLEIEFMLEGQSKYKDKLSNLSFTPPVLNPNTQADWLIFIRFNKNEPVLQNQMCQFNLIFDGFNKNISENSNLKFKKLIQNSIQSGFWN